MSKSLKLSLILLAMAAAAAAQQVSAEQPPLFNPYERPKNGPPLTKVFHKVETSWLLRKLRDPKHHPSARMPDFQFTEEEALDIMAYLKSVAGKPLPAVQWPVWAAKDMEEMEDDEFEAMLELSDRGKAVWSNARCTVCHAVNGPGGVIGGFVDLRVGGIDLQIAASKLKRDWLYTWL
jgi:mono/diheme cytochrome c family protein